MREPNNIVEAWPLPSPAEIAELREAILDSPENDVSRRWSSEWAQQVHGGVDFGLLAVIDTLALACARIAELEASNKPTPVGYVIARPTGRVNEASATEDRVPDAEWILDWDGAIHPTCKSAEDELGRARNSSLYGDLGWQLFQLRGQGAGNA